jgi:hypothetical protein
MATIHFKRLHTYSLGGVVAQREGWWLLGRRGGSLGRRGGSMVVHQTVVLQSWVRIRCLSIPQLTANLLVGCHLGWHLAAG